MNILFEEFNDVLKVTLPDYPGDNFFYCDLDMLPILQSAPEISFYLSDNKKSRYVQVGDKALHRLIFEKDGVDLTDLCIDHISGVTFDNCRKNLRAIQYFENLLNNPKSGVAIPRKSHLFEINCNCSAIGYRFSCSFTTERQALRCKAEVDYSLRTLFHVTTYEFLKDRRNDSDLVCELREGKITEEQELQLYLSRYTDNCWYYYRYFYELKDYENLFDFTGVVDSSVGFLVDRKTGKALSPYHNYSFAIQELIDLDTVLKDVGIKKMQVEKETANYTEELQKLNTLKQELYNEKENATACLKAVEFLNNACNPKYEFLKEQQENIDLRTLFFVKQYVLETVYKFNQRLKQKNNDNSTDDNYLSSINMMDLLGIYSETLSLTRRYKDSFSYSFDRDFIDNYLAPEVKTLEESLLKCKEVLDLKKELGLISEDEYNKKVPKESDEDEDDFTLF